MTSAYFADLVPLPTIIVAPGAYITRGGLTVRVSSVSDRHDFGCDGRYPGGIPESWHKSGRILASRETTNDIIRSIP